MTGRAETLVVVTGAVVVVVVGRVVLVVLVVVLVDVDVLVEVVELLELVVRWTSRAGSPAAREHPASRATIRARVRKRAAIPLDRTHPQVEAGRIHGCGRPVPPRQPVEAAAGLGIPAGAWSHPSGERLEPGAVSFRESAA